METDTTLELYRKALNFNVIGRYDPKIKQLLFHTPHATVYKWDFQDKKWSKLDYQGVLAIYLRDVFTKNSLLAGTQNHDQSTISRLNNGVSDLPSELLKGYDIYNYGLIILNRISPDNFSLGIVPNSVVNKRKLFSPEEELYQPLEQMGVEVKNDLVIIKNLRHEVFGIWIHTPTDRENVYELIKYLLENEPKTSFT